MKQILLWTIAVWVTIYERLVQCDGSLSTLWFLQRSASQLHSFIRAANLQEARGLMDGVTVRAKDRAGRTALHKALLYEKTFITKHIAQNFKEIINLQDAVSKTMMMITAMIIITLKIIAGRENSTALRMLYEGPWWPHRCLSGKWRWRGHKRPGRTLIN